MALTTAAAQLSQRAIQSAPKLSLVEFVRAGWHVVEPATPFVDGWHIRAICEHLEAVSRGEIRDLVINVPPRHAKSLVVSVFWPCWEWSREPAQRYLFASYAAVLSIRDSVKCRRLIESPWYQRHWGAVFQLTSDQNAKTRFDNNRSGYRIATSVGGVGTGDGGSRIVVDDPGNVTEAESETRRQAVIEWWDAAMSTRGNDPKTVARVIVMQRTHQHDLSGHVLEQGGWEHLCLPARYEGSEHVTAIGWRDPRTEPGELLWPERFDDTAMAKLEHELGGAASGQLQQRPQPRTGNLFKRAWWRRYQQLPRLTRAAIFVDSAFKTGVANDFTVLALWGTDGQGNFYLVDLWRAKVEYPDLLQAIHDFHAKHRKLVAVLPVVIEDKANGQSAIQSLSRPLPVASGPPLPALPVLPFPNRDDPREVQLARLDKYARAEGVTATVASGHAFLPEGAPWLESFITEHADFPSAANDDQVDTTSMGLTRLNTAAAREFASAVGGSRPALGLTPRGYPGRF